MAKEKQEVQLLRTSLLLFVATLSLASCQSAPSKTDLVWAVNVGGEAYRSSDGIDYAADEFGIGGETGTLASVKGTQDPTLYQTYRQGDIAIQRSIDNGVYDVTLYFAEPEDIAGGERVFNVRINDHVVFEELDVMSYRDGQVRSALTVTAPNVRIGGGELRISFEAMKKQPILSAVVVRNKNRPAPEWELVWSDEFDQDGAPNPENWTIREWPPRTVNSEDQAYTAREKNVRVVDGMLVIEAHKEEYGDAQYTSGRIYSSGKQDFLYGRFEARAKVPAGQGNWAAIWMLPSDPFKYASNCSDIEDWQGNKDCDAWPNSGEIDILEHVSYLQNHVHGTVHNRAYYFKNFEQRKGRVIFDDLSESFHDYVVEWYPDRIDMFVDDTLYFSYVNENEGWREWPYDHPFHLIVNLAIGGDWGRAGGPIDDSTFPQKLLVDYLRVYRLAEN